ncbi:alpha/beta hydrolase [Flavobacterium agrisoli]|uniref:Alpha/beta hydrolase n=1 Tax=Flavobacterium agrisoli TaxID=2793066 RepID=A0A934PLY2_9FLAO|nr:alpha/beta hydrolase-fold protein [Flavobacterium agrisoli]MBK0369245.1 alpha/beta hydrolase [Flavobacterium agrisoli]
MTTRFLIQTLFLILFSFISNAQDSINIGSIHKIPSKILNEERTIWVYLPADYNNTKYQPARYPVAYLLDAESNFHSFTGIIQNLAKGPYSRIPQMIVVGICNTDRTRDLTPTEANKQAFFSKNRKKAQATGGNENFIAFLEKELRPYIDSKFRTSGYNLLNGHSFGGLTATNILLNHSSLFNAYVIIDPSLWWDNELLNKQADSIFTSKDFEKRNIYVAMANKRAIPQDTTTDMARGIEKFKLLLETKKPQNLRWGFHFYENEDHGTIPIPAEYDGLRFIFKNHLVEVKQAAHESELVTQQFQKLSADLGFPFQPSESYLDWMGNYCLDTERPQLAIPFFELIEKTYNKSKSGVIGLQKANAELSKKPKSDR